MAHKTIILMPIFAIGLVLFLTSLVMFQTKPASALSASMLKPTPTPFKQDNGINQTIKEVITAAITSEARYAPVYILTRTKIERIIVSSDESIATAWLVPIDSQSNQIIPTEPGLVVVKRFGANWQAFLPTSINWISLVQSLPGELITEEEKTTWLTLNASREALAQQGPYSGYLLPWAGGVTMAMTQSVAHDHYTPSGNAHYAFDFATPGQSQMFNLYSAKAGTVKFVKDTCENGSETCSNWLVLQDTTTNPTTYQLYLHLAKNSIPAELHTIGKMVYQGQYIGIADDTGISTGHHLHFMVHTNPTSYWGSSVDITFGDVSINGGRPRILSDKPYCQNNQTYHDVCDQFSNYYVSGNHPEADQTPPYGDMLNPVNGITIESGVMHMEGWADDDQSGLANAQFIAKYNDAWQPIGNPFTTLLFSMDWDLCASAVPDGPVDIAIRIQDKAGNLATGLPGLRHLIKNYTCPTPPPTCSPTANQVALFTESDYKGSCDLFSTGNYSSTLSFGSLGDDSVTSIKVGQNVVATLYINNNYKGRGESFIRDDSNLTENIVGLKTTSSMIIRSRNSNPGVPSPVWPLNGMDFSAGSSLSLVWDNGGSTTEYQTKWVKDGTITQVSSWLKTPYWNLGSLQPGSYTWQVKGRNNYAESDWNPLKTFSIAQPSQTIPNAIGVPFSDNMEGSSANWIRSAYWDRTTDKNHTPAGSISWKYDVNGQPQDGYDTGSPNSGDLTSIPFIIPSGSEYYLRFWYLYETENEGKNWDQRWIQISIDGGSFTNTVQLGSDPKNTWLLGPIIPLTQYQGHTIQIRFHFETMDKYNNKYQGWFIDDFSITNDSPPSCYDPYEPNNSPSQATEISYYNPAGANICPGGDIDFYKFSAQAGDQLGATVFAQSSYPTSKLDSYLYLLDADGTSVLAENDDQVAGQRTDSEIAYTITRSSEYCLLVRAWDNPSAGGMDYGYTLGIYSDKIDPSAMFLYPNNGSVIPNSMLNLVVDATDNQSGTSHVLFFWHSSDWLNDNWNYIGEDWDGSDGWNIAFNATNLPLQNGLAFFAKVYDRAGNWRSTGIWNLRNTYTYLFFPLIVR